MPRSRSPSPAWQRSPSPRLRQERRRLHAGRLPRRGERLPQRPCRRAREVRLSGDTPISDCLAENQDGGDLASVGEALVEAATKLNAEARAEPGGGANLQLGYLLGAAQRGADRTEGIHADLVRRLAVAARYSPGSRPLPPAFLRTYREGFDAGHARG